MGIGGESVVWVALCRCDWWEVVVWGCVIVIGGEGVVWVALCRCDWLDVA